MRARDYVAEPHIILFGCRPHVPHDPAHLCPVCKAAIGLPRLVHVDGQEPYYVVDERDRTTYCAHCDAMSPANEGRLLAQRIGVRGKDRATRAEEAALRALDQQAKGNPALTELERRRLWNGYRGGVRDPLRDVPNRAHLGREWLRSIGQEPDWDLWLDREGRIKGRLVRNDVGQVVEKIARELPAAAV